MLLALGVQGARKGIVIKNARRLTSTTPGKVFHGGAPYVYGARRVMNDKFCDKWLEKIEYHDVAAETGFFTAYMDVEFASGSFDINWPTA
jgi:hypothetical protein